MKLKQANLLNIFFSLTVCACTTDIPNSRSTDQSNINPLQAVWVVLGDQGLATARAITFAKTCPDLMQDGVASTMQIRAAPATLSPRPVSIVNTAMTSGKPAAFPVLTCEAPLKSGVTAASVSGKSLPVPKPEPLKILILGDTGCRLKTEGNAFQSCDDADKWAFPTVAKMAAQFAPDLVIHVGDYQYRESPCPANGSACANSPWGYGWDTWQADFFTPAAPLLAAAPWVMVRGNHESCFRAGQGWWRFLDPRVLQTGRDCIVETDDMAGDNSSPYAVPFGGGAQLIVFDSSKASTQALAKNDPAYPVYLQEFNQVDQLAKQAEFSIFIAHHPILGFAPEKGKAGEVEVRPGNLALQSVLQDIHPKRLFDPHIQLLLAGHVHLFEAIIFDTDHPMQVVSGNGGASPDVNLPASLPAQATPFASARVAYFNSTNQSGFTTLERASADSTEWMLKAWDKNGVLMTACIIGKDNKTCSEM